MEFKKATRKQAKARIAIAAPSGSGKTYTALLIAKGLGCKIAVLDTEHGSASKYADDKTIGVDFDVLELDSFHPQKYVDAIKAAETAGYEVLIIDSLSHAWMGKDGALELVDKAAKRTQSNNKFTAWGDVTPLQTQLVESMIGAKLHIIVTMRSKTEYVLEENDKGKKVPRKIGMAPIQRDGLEYEFDVVADMNLDHDFIVSRTRYSALADAVIRKPDHKLGKQILGWLNSGEAVKDAPKQEEPQPKAETAKPVTKPKVEVKREIKQDVDIKDTLEFKNKVMDIESIVDEHRKILSEHSLQVIQDCVMRAETMDHLDKTISWINNAVQKELAKSKEVA